jgi:hypothetical protein
MMDTFPSVQEIAEGALKILDEHGWYQGGPTGPGGQVCMASAILKYLSGTLGSYLSGTWGSLAFPMPPFLEALHAFREVITGLYPERSQSGPYISVTIFNDHKDTTEEDVRLVLKTLAAS